MPISDVTTGHGSELYIHNGTNLEKVAEVDDIPELPSGEQELYEVSHLGTTGYREWKKQPLRDGVPVTLTGNYVIASASDALLQSADDAEGPLAYKIVIPQGEDSYEVTGTALFYGFRRMNAKDAKRTFQITMKPVDAADIDEAV